MATSRRRFLAALGASICLGGRRWASAASRDAAPPNIVIIIGDDIGYSDFGCYGSEIDTPNINRLAARGLRFTQYHTENMCAPSRATLLTGRYWIRGFSNGDNVTIPEALSPAGYRSCMAGKWHNTDDRGGPEAPRRRGFERFFGTPIGCGSFFAPLRLNRDGEPAEDEWKNDKDFYYTDAISKSAVTYIRETPANTPLFLYVAYTAAHWPLHARPEDIAKYQGKYVCGWDELRRRRHARMKELGVVRPDTPLSPRHPTVPAWEDEPHKAWQQHRMEVYAAQIDRMDQGIGQIVDALARTGRLKNTLLMLTVDNGGCHVEYGASRKGPFLNSRTRDGRPIKVGNTPEVMPGPEDTWQSYGYGWANASNTPLRMFKQYDHEGGTRVPLIAHWPQTIADGGRITHQVAHVIDLLPTCLDVAGVEYPETYAGRAIAPADGKSLLPIFRGQTRQEHAALFWKFAHGRAVRQGQWKLVKMDAGPWELYDLDDDPVELANLADTQPEKVRHLASLWDDWADTQPPKAKRGKKQKKRTKPT